MVANANKKNSRYTFEKITTLLNAQIENSLECRWNPIDIYVLANFDYTFMDVSTVNISELPDTCLTGSKMFGLNWYIKNTSHNEVVWSHDLDAWQNAPFQAPEIKDVGIARYSNDKFNGGSVFWKMPSSKDIIQRITQVLVDEKAAKEEPTLNKILKKEFKDRITVIDNTFNVGCSGYVVRLSRSEKPLKVCHFHPYNRIAWETHVLDRNQINEIGVTVRLERLLRKYYPELATELSMTDEDKKLKRKKFEKYIR